MSIIPLFNNLFLSVPILVYIYLLKSVFGHSFYFTLWIFFSTLFFVFVGLNAAFLYKPELFIGLAQSNIYFIIVSVLLFSMTFLILKAGLISNFFSFVRDKDKKVGFWLIVFVSALLCGLLLYPESIRDNLLLINSSETKDDTLKLNILMESFIFLGVLSLLPNILGKCMNKSSPDILLLSKSLAGCVLLASAIAILNERVLGLIFEIPIPFAPYIGGILFFSFLVLLNTPPPETPSFSQNFSYLFMAAFGLFLARPILFDIQWSITHSNWFQNEVVLENEKGGFTWHTAIEEAKKEAGKSQSLILIYFSADWCLPCLEMEKRFFPSVEFKRFVKKHNTTLLLYDMDEEDPQAEEIASQYSVLGLPTMIIVDHQGVEVDKVTGFKSTSITIQELEKVVKKNYTKKRNK